MGIREIANKAGVSIATVSRSLNNPELVEQKTRNKVLTIANEVGYQKYQSNFAHRPAIEGIGVIIPNVYNPFFARILEGINKKSIELGLPFILYLTNNNTKTELYAIDNLINQKVKGVIFIRAKNKEATSSRNIQKLKQYDIPVVLIDRDIKNKDYSGVFLSNANAVYDAVHLLIADGYKKICMIAGPDDNLNSNQRLEGYKSALRGNGLKVDTDMIYTSDFSVQSGLEITQKILQKKSRPEVIFACSNQISIGCIQALRQNKLVLGKEIELFSFNELDDYHIDTFDIAYIEHPLGVMGEKSVSILKNKIVGTKGSIREILHYQIINKKHKK